MSAASLDPRLLPESSIPGFGLERRLDWTDPVNLVGEGLDLPQASHPAAAVKEFESSKLEGAAGEVLKKGSGLNATEVHVGVARFHSATTADKVKAWMHGQDLQQPCFSECAFSPQATQVPGVPGAAAVAQVAGGGRPGSAPKSSAPATYLGEFTLGPYLYWVWVPADAAAKTRAQFIAGVRLYYQHAKKQQS